MKAMLKNYTQPPRKVRLVANIVRGKLVNQAYIILQTLDKKSALPVFKLIQSAVANAGDAVPVEKLAVESIVVNEGRMLKRFRPRAKGRSSPIRRRSSTICVELASK